MTITPPLKWHGGKHYLAPQIVALMPPHVHYVEPYFGGGSVLLHRNPADPSLWLAPHEGVSEVANDLHIHLTNFWACLQNQQAFAEFARLAEAIPFSENEYNDACRELLPSDCADGYGRFSVIQAVQFFVRCRQSHSGRMKDFAAITRKRVRAGMNEQVSAWLNCVEGLPAVHARLKRVLILNKPALEVIRSEDTPGTLFYLDPPYLHATRATTGEYEHEMNGDDHADLLATLADVTGKFLLSGYRSEMYDVIAKKCGWNRADIDMPNNAAGGRKKRRMVESVWMNYAPKVKP